MRKVIVAVVSGTILAGCTAMPNEETVVIPIEPVGGGKSSVAIEPEPTLGGDLPLRAQGRYAVAEGAVCPHGHVGIYRGNLYCG